MIVAAELEALAEDATTLADRARSAGVDVRLTMVEDTVHQFVLFDDPPETADALAQLRELAANVTPRA